MLQRLNQHRSFGGTVEYYSHLSESTLTKMQFSVFRPPQAETRPVPVLYWLSGLTCTEENFMAKAGAQRAAAELGLFLVAPDTSPRGAGVPGEGDSWDLGLGAGFYINATEPEWKDHYRMYDYITLELPEIIRSNFPVNPEKESIFGHSMGGHGAMIAALRQPGRYQSVSAFAPICAPSLCPWGRRAFSTYLGSNQSAWHEWDTHMLVAGATTQQPILIDQGTGDKFLIDQLLPGVLREVARQVNYPIELRMQEGYDHSYYFMATFMEDHLRYHKASLGD